MAFLIKLGAPEVCRRVLDVLKYMESLLLPLLPSLPLLGLVSGVQRGSLLNVGQRADDPS